MFKHNLNSGMSLMEVMIAVAISSVVVGGATYIAIEGFKADQKEESIYWLQQRRAEILYAIQSENGWNQIQSLNPNIKCGDPDQSSAACVPFQTPQNLVLRVGNQTLNGGQTGTGIDAKGNFCTSFQPDGGSSCSVGLDLKWQMVCGSANCVDAQPLITVRFQHASGQQQKLNLSSYDIRFYKDPKQQSYSEVCASLGGTMSGVTCTFTQAECDPSNASGAGATYPLGFDAEGKVICGRPQLSQCSSAEVVTGFKSSGDVICSPRCN